MVKQGGSETAEYDGSKLVNVAHSRCQRSLPYVAGKVIGFEGTEYEVRLSSGQQVKWSEEEVRHGWIEDQYIMRRGWTAKDQRTLQEGVRGVVAKKVQEKRHRHVSPFPSRIDGKEWEVEETWYTCSMKAPSVGRAKALLVEGEDLQAAELLVAQGTLFWAPANTWPEWIAASPTSKTGWWVKATGVRREGKQLTLEIRSVQRDEFHRLGDIRVDGPATVKARQAWRLRQVLQATTPTWAVLAEEELERGAGGFQRCDALQTFRDTEPRVEAERSEEGAETAEFFRIGA
jgi:hypothetical protein